MSSVVLIWIFSASMKKNTFFPEARKLSFALESGKELKHVILTRDFLAKLMWARIRINSYKMKPSGKLLFDTVIFLEKNGFEQLGYMLEESELKQYAETKSFRKISKLLHRSNKS